MLRYEGIEVENLRCIRRMKIENLSRVNLFVGKNGSGKTTLLEALFIHSGLYNPELVLRVNAFRGIEVFKVDPLQVSETPWSSLFNNYDAAVPIRIASHNVNGRQETTLKNLNIDEKFKLIERMRSSGLDVSNLSAESIQVLELQSTYQSNVKRNFYLIIDQTGIRSFPAPLIPPYPCVFLDAKRRSPTVEIAHRYSSLLRGGEKLEELISMIGVIEPRIRDLRPLLIGNALVLHADIGIKKYIPVYYLGDGLLKVLDIGLAMYSVRDGVLLIDEIEDGIHYSILEEYWTNILKLARSLNVQVFATTHSYECLAAAHRAFSKNPPYDFKLYRLERQNGDVRVVEYSQEELDTSIEVGFEVR